MAEQVTKLDLASAEPAPSIERVDDGKGGTKILGRNQYAAALVPRGQVVTAELKVNGVVVRTLGSWTATAEDGANPYAQLRLRVKDDYPKASLPKVVVAEPEPV